MRAHRKIQRTDDARKDSGTAKEELAFARSTDDSPTEQGRRRHLRAQMREGGSLRKLSSDWVCVLSGIGKQGQRSRGRTKRKVKEVQEETVPNIHLEESESEWSRAVLKLFGLRTLLYS